MTVLHKVHIPIYLFLLLKCTVLYKMTSEHMGTPEKHTPQLSVIPNLNVRFADENSKSLLKILMAHLYLFVWH